MGPCHTPGGNFPINNCMPCSPLDAVLCDRLQDQQKGGHEAVLDAGGGGHEGESKLTNWTLQPVTICTLLARNVPCGSMATGDCRDRTRHQCLRDSFATESVMYQSWRC